MSKVGPIIIVEQDIDDQGSTAEALMEIGVKNQLQFFSSAEQALKYLQETNEKPFIILLEVMFTKMNGLELQKRIHESEFLRKKSIPLIFFSSVDNPSTINKAFNQTTQGYFKKPNHINELVEIFHFIIGYWNRSVFPVSD